VRILARAAISVYMQKWPLSFGAVLFYIEKLT